MQKIISRKLRRHDIRRNEGALVDRRQQIVDEDRLAGADLPGNDDEALSVVKAVD